MPLSADLAGLTPRHNHGRPIRGRDAAVGVRALAASSGWHQPVRGLAESRYDCLRSLESREEPRELGYANGTVWECWVPL
jgi:hypothetical protein